MIKVLVFAHQGGWDEILIVAGPLIVVATLLWVADRDLLIHNLICFSF